MSSFVCTARSPLHAGRALRRRPQMRPYAQMEREPGGAYAGSRSEEGVPFGRLSRENPSHG